MRWLRLDHLLHRSDGSRISLWAEPGEDRSGDLRYQRVVIDRLALVDVRYVKLDDRATEHLECIEDRDRREAEAGRIDYDARAVVDGLMDPVDDLAFVVRLMEADGPVARCFAA